MRVRLQLNKCTKCTTHSCILTYLLVVLKRKDSLSLLPYLDRLWNLLLDLRIASPSAASVLSLLLELPKVALSQEHQLSLFVLFRHPSVKIRGLALQVASRVNFTSDLLPQGKVCCFVDSCSALELS